MQNIPLVKKASGDLEPFSRAKFENSLRNAGAGDALIRDISDDLQDWLHEGITTKQIYTRAFSILRKKTPSSASRYKLKKAIMELGPTGFPFERLVAEITRLQGFTVEVDQVLQGHCVTHEVDVVATKENKQFFVECKYYLSTGKNANVQVPLYIRSRVDDIIKYRETLPEFKDFSFYGWIVTNTRFTSDAIDFGKCSGLHLLSWDYPAGNGLKEIIDRERIFPITVLSRLTNLEKQMLMERNIVICRQLVQEPDALDFAGLQPRRKQQILDEVKGLCSGL